MIYYSDNKVKKLDTFFTGHVPNDYHCADDTLEFIEQSCQSPWCTLFLVWHESSDWWPLWVQQWIVDCSHTRYPTRTSTDKNLGGSDGVNAETTLVCGICSSAN